MRKTKAMYYPLAFARGSKNQRNTSRLCFSFLFVWSSTSGFLGYLVVGAQVLIFLLDGFVSYMSVDDIAFL